MIITVYRYDSGYHNITDTLSLIPLSGDNICTDEICLVLPAGYTLADSQGAGPQIYDERNSPCDLCLNNRKGTAVLAISATRTIGLKRVKDGSNPVPLQEARLAAGLTLAQLSEASGVNERQIRRVESGESAAGNLTAKNLLALADTLGIDPRKLI